MPTKTHQQIVHALLALLLSHLRHARAGDAVAAPYRMRLREGTFREPDIAVYTTAHLDRFGERYGEPADMVVEVVGDDEVGRGTSTYDGLAIAQAVIEDLRGRAGCRTLFATHYLQLAELARLPGIANAQVVVRQHRDELVFLHQVVPGAADKSWGVHVAKLAGVPEGVIERAGQLLAGFERGNAVPAVFDADLAAEPPEEFHAAPEVDDVAAEPPLDAAAPSEPATSEPATGRPARPAQQPRRKPAAAEQRSLFE